MLVNDLANDVTHAVRRSALLKRTPAAEKNMKDVSWRFAKEQIERVREVLDSGLVGSARRGPRGESDVLRT